MGLAIVDSIGIMATPLPFLPARPIAQFWNLLGGIVRARDVQTIVIGLPLHTSGEEGTAAARARRLAVQIGERHLCSVELWDERFTTAHARRLLQESGVSSRKEKRDIDSLAAVLLLESWLQRQGAAMAGGIRSVED